MGLLGGRKRAESRANGGYHVRRNRTNDTRSRSWRRCGNIATYSTGVASCLDAEADKRVEKVLSKKQAEWEKQLQDRLAEAENKGAEYAKMTAAEKAEADLQQRMDALEQREQAIKQRELSASVASDLAEQGLPVELADNLTAIGDPAAIKEWVSTIKDTISTAVNEQVKERLNTGKPTSTATNLNASDDPLLQLLPSTSKGYLKMATQLFADKFVQLLPAVFQAQAAFTGVFEIYKR